jgi:hypothetical protein
METRGGAALVVADGDESRIVEAGSMLSNFGKTQNCASSEARWGFGVVGNLHGGCAQPLWALVEVGERCSGDCHGVRDDCNGGGAKHLRGGEKRRKRWRNGVL